MFMMLISWNEMHNAGLAHCSQKSIRMCAALRFLRSAREDEADDISLCRSRSVR